MFVLFLELVKLRLEKSVNFCEKDFLIVRIIYLYTHTYDEYKIFNVDEERDQKKRLCGQRSLLLTVTIDNTGRLEKWGMK